VSVNVVLGFFIGPFLSVGVAEMIEIADAVFAPDNLPLDRIKDYSWPIAMALRVAAWAGLRMKVRCSTIGCTHRSRDISVMCNRSCNRR
jgi:hypothetical protein